MNTTPTHLKIPGDIMAATGGLRIQVQATASTSPREPIMVAEGELRLEEKKNETAVAKILFSTGQTRFLTQDEIDRLKWKEPKLLFLPIQ